MAWKRKRRWTAGKLGVKWMERAKEIEALTLAKRFPPSKEMGQTGTTRKEWVKGKLLMI